MKKLPSLLGMARKAAGFTMIELLIVITILGILAVAVLSAINPLEQINRGRDTSSQSDAEQLINAMERFTAFQEYLPWLEDRSVSTADQGAIATPQIVNTSWVTIADDTGATTTCPVIDRLGTNDSGLCSTGTNEVKSAYVNRLLDNGDANTERALYVVKETGDTSSNLYVCFQPQSQAFLQRAAERCGTSQGATDSEIPDDLAWDDDSWDAICGTCAAEDPTQCWSCIP